MQSVPKNKTRESEYIKKKIEEYPANGGKIVKVETKDNKLTQN